MQYLRDYVINFNLETFILCSAKVERVRRGTSKASHVLDIRQRNGNCFQWHCDAVAVSSGLNCQPLVPALKGIDRVPTVLHSSQVKRREQFGRDSTVVILGAGETAMDMAQLAVTSPSKEVVLCHRDGFFCAPKAWSCTYICVPLS